MSVETRATCSDYEAFLDILDAQVHIGPGKIDQTLAAMDALGVRSIVIDELWMQGMLPGYALPGGGYRAIAPTAELAATLHPDRFAYLLRVDRADPELPATVRSLRDNPGARALRIIPGMSRGELKAFEGGEYRALFALAADAGLPVFAYVPGSAHMVTQYAAEFRGLRIIVDHCGMPQQATSHDPSELIAQFDQVLALSVHANVALKWAHAPAMFNVPGYPGERLAPVLRRAIDAYGCERIMWASDITANQSGETWSELLFNVRGNSDLSNLEKDQILGATARAWLGWPRAHE